MKTQRKQLRRDDDYECRVSVEFSDLDAKRGLETPAEGELKIILGDDLPHPVELGVRDIEGEDGNAAYVEFEKRTQTVNEQIEYPAVFSFITHPSSEKGGKWYFYRTANWTPRPDDEPYLNPEFVKHHVAIPSAQKIRLVHRILEGEAGEAEISALQELYGTNRGTAASAFSDDIKVHVGFESRTVVQNFLMEYTGFHRSHSDTVNKVAKQLVKEEYRHRVRSVADLREMLTTVNQQPNFADITIEQVVRKVVERCTKGELDDISNHLEIDDWSVLFSE